MAAIAIQPPRPVETERARRRRRRRLRAAVDQAMHELALARPRTHRIAIAPVSGAGEAG